MLDLYWKSIKTRPDDHQMLKNLATSIFSAVSGEPGEKETA